MERGKRRSVRRGSKCLHSTIWRNYDWRYKWSSSKRSFKSIINSIYWIGGGTMTKKYEFQYDGNGEKCAITIVGENISIPFDPANSDYQAYLESLNDPSNQL